jgi:hypothetical protein
MVLAVLEVTAAIVHLHQIQVTQSILEVVVMVELAQRTVTLEMVELGLME